jgi:hypothetical protein
MPTILRAARTVGLIAIRRGVRYQNAFGRTLGELALQTEKSADGKN